MKGSIHSAPQELVIVPIHVLAVTLHTRGFSSERGANLFLYLFILKPNSLPFVKCQYSWHRFKSGYLASRFVICVCPFLYDQAVYSKTTETCRQRCVKGEVYVCTEHFVSQLTNRRANCGRSRRPFGLSVHSCFNRIAGLGIRHLEL
jgi:hypothetical protein